MRIDVITLFPAMLQGPLSESLIQKAQQKGLLSLNIVNLRDFTSDKHKTADDSPYGGGAGMVMKVDVIAKALGEVGKKVEIRNSKLDSRQSKIENRIVLMCPSGQPLTQAKVNELAKAENLIILCGHYEGVDERVRELVDEEISIGDYVLTGGEIPALVLIDAVARQIPGVVKEEDSIKNDSFYNGLLDYPSYTRPEEFEGKRVPEVLLSGHHAEIEKWRRKEALKKTFERRPDLLAKANLSESDRKILKELLNNG
ncbi:MAG: tRNA (guanosine(37)-N1)-methyltransferase TrmD [Candidatus Margulisiibacteriota bacterium]